MAANKRQQRNAIRKFSFYARGRKSNKRQRPSQSTSKLRQFRLAERTPICEFMIAFSSGMLGNSRKFKLSCPERFNKGIDGQGWCFKKVSTHLLEESVEGTEVVEEWSISHFPTTTAPHPQSCMSVPVRSFAFGNNTTCRGKSVSLCEIILCWKKRDGPSGVEWYAQSTSFNKTPPKPH